MSAARPSAAAPSGPLATGGNSVPRVMWLVLAALLPVVVVEVVLYGPAPLFQLAIAGSTALACEWLALRARGRRLTAPTGDGSALVTAALLGLAVPPLLPWWLTVIGTALALLLGKHVFGGLGWNPFNPAMVGYAALLISFPVEMTRWPLPVGGELGWSELAGLGARSVLGIGGATAPAWDAYTGATALDALHTGLGLRLTMEEIRAQPAFGTFGGAGAQWVNLAALAGGLLLLERGVIRWQIPVAMLGAVVACSLVLHALDPGRFAGPLLHLFSGATMLGAFFIATDPVTAATSDRGRIVYGAGIGLLTCLIRSFGGYPDGVAFAVLLLNLAVPTIDRYSVPRIHGHPRH